MTNFASIAVEIPEYGIASVVGGVTITYPVMPVDDTRYGSVAWVGCKMRL